MTKSATLGQQLWQSSALGLGLMNAQRQLIEVNDTFCDIYGYDRDELLEQSPEKLIPNHFRERALLSYQNYVNGNPEQGLQYIQRKDGSQQYVRVTVENMDADTESPLQLVTITTLPSPASPVQKPVSRPSLPTSFSGVFLFECDRNGKCLKSNEVAQRLGIRPHQTLPHQVAIYSGQIQRTMPLTELLNERKLWENAEWQLDPEDDRPLWVLANTQTTDQQTTVVCLVPIDAQKRLEDTLTRNLHTLRASNQHLERFLYGATHDLKAPLASLLGLIDIFRSEEDPEQQALYLQLMEKSISRLNEFIHEIVDYSKNSNQSLRQNAIDFKTLTNEVFESLGYVTFASQIEKKIEVHQTAPFHSDAHRIKVVLSNLVSNAYKYSSVHRRPGVIRVSVFASEQEATIQICDNGLGIAKEHIGKIFDMFYRASEQQTGSGLGLYIVKETIEKMNGTISVDSTLGEGTCFTVSLPASPSSSKQQMHLNL
ncbi:MAG: PAS domain-containing sensor histidine kinase [Cyclobacteriaceae bacterium]